MYRFLKIAGPLEKENRSHVRQWRGPWEMTGGFIRAQVRGYADERLPVDLGHSGNGKRSFRIRTDPWVDQQGQTGRSMLLSPLSVSPHRVFLLGVGTYGTQVL